MKPKQIWAYRSRLLEWDRIEFYAKDPRETAKRLNCKLQNLWKEAPVLSDRIGITCNMLGVMCAAGTTLRRSQVKPLYVLDAKLWGVE